MIEQVHKRAGNAKCSGIHDWFHEIMQGKPRIANLLDLDPEVVNSIFMGSS